MSKTAFKGTTVNLAGEFIKTGIFSQALTLVSAPLL